MIRTGLPSPLRTLLARPLRPTSSPLARPFSLSSPSLADGLFPEHAKQNIGDLAQPVINTVDQASIGGPDNQGIDGPDKFGLVDGAQPLPASIPSEGISSSSSTFPTVNTAASEDTPTSTSSDSSNPFSSNPSEDDPSSSSFGLAPSPPAASPPPLNPFQPLSLLPDALQEARRSLGPTVTPMEWAHLKGPRPTLKTIRLSLTSSKNNTKGVLTYAYDPATYNDTSKWNAKVAEGKFSGGTLGFKGTQSGGNEAGHQVVINLFRRIREENEKELELRKKRQEENGEKAGYLQDPVGLHVQLNLRGFGHGRLAFDKAIRSEEGSVVRACATSITDKSAVKRAWNRAPGRRRV